MSNIFIFTFLKLTYDQTLEQVLHLKVSAPPPPKKNQPRIFLPSPVQFSHPSGKTKDWRKEKSRTEVQQSWTQLMEPLEEILSFESRAFETKMPTIHQAILRKAAG